MERREVCSTSKKPHQAFSVNDFMSFRYMEGEQVELLSERRKPDKAVILKDYPNTVLIGIQYGPHLIRFMPPKAALYAGDVRMRTMDGKKLYESEVMRSGG